MATVNYQQRGTAFERLLRTFEGQLIERIREQKKSGTLTLCNWKVGGSPLEQSQVEWSQFGDCNEEVTRICQKIRDQFHVKVLPSKLGLSFCIYIYFDSPLEGVERKEDCCTLL